MTIGTIVIIVLALIVLVVLVVGFTSGWTNLWERMTGFFSSGANIDSIVQACQMACATQARYDYCSRIRAVRFEVNGKVKKAEISCNTLEEKSGKEVLDADDPTATVILPSVELSCDLDCLGTPEDTEKEEEKKEELVTCNSLGGAWQTSGHPCTGGDVTSKVTDFTDRPSQTHRCCKY